MKKIYTLTLASILIAINVQAQPGTPATTPPIRNTTDVISLYSGAYSNIDSTDFYPSWGQTTTIAEFIVAADTMIKYDNFNYQGIQVISAKNISNMKFLHLDVWTPNATAFDVFLINTTPTTVEQKVTLTPTLNGWNSFDIDLSLYTTIALHNIRQIKMVTTPFGGATVYLDNLYFYKSATTPTITGFNIPAKAVTAAPFVIPAPTSNSPVPFTYTSSNPAVASVSGNLITVHTVGYTYITANQLAGGAYVAGSVSTTLDVTTGLSTTPTTPAPTPTKAAANVISLFSDVYPNRKIDTWSAVWDVADVADFIISGDSTKKYTNLNYAGVEFTTNTIDATNAQFYHVDIWTPNATSFKVKLVDFGANGTYGGGDDTEFEYTCNNPAFSTWVSYDIPMSAFATLTSRAHLAQMLFVSSASTVYVDNVYFWANVILPVKLSDFTATKKDASVVLNWNTSNEVNNDGFKVERSIDGRNFENIGFVKSNTSNVYSFIDTKPLNSVIYYRLKQMDNNGKYVYSSIVSINFKAQTSSVSFYPNPAKNNLYVTLGKIENENASISLIDIAGKTIKSQTISSKNSNSSVVINVTNLNKAVYFLVIKDGKTTNSHKVIIE